MFNPGLIKDYLLHRLRANNRHGLHSPFVYRLTDEVIYDFRAKKTYPKAGKSLLQTKVNRLIYRLVADWQPVNIIIFGDVSDDRKSYLRAGAPGTEINIVSGDDDTFVNGAVIDFALIGPGNPAQILKYFDCCMTHAHEKTMLIVTGIYNNPAMKKAWHEIKSRAEVTVTIDLFWMGLVYFRKGQVKEHFKIKF